INGGTYTVHENLCWALYYLRPDVGSRTRVLWTDAICIDQESYSERNHQLAQIGTIYRSTTKVLAWLGAPGQESWLAFDISSKCPLFRASGSNHRFRC
ncbi:heterokaryon incompatibility, partial [Halenospora varia]